MTSGDIGRRIKALREERGWTQFELSRRSGVGQPSINQYESGKRTEIQLTNLIALAKAFRVTLDELCGYDVTKVPEMIEKETPGASRRLATVEREMQETRDEVRDIRVDLAEVAKSQAKNFSEIRELLSKPAAQPKRQPRRKRS